MEQEVQDFFTALINNTSEKYRKIPTDICRNYGYSETLTVKQAEWIETALKRTKALRGIAIPAEIQREMDYALDDSPPVEVTEELKEIIFEELAEAVSRIIDRIHK